MFGSSRLGYFEKWNNLIHLFNFGCVECSWVFGEWDAWKHVGLLRFYWKWRSNECSSLFFLLCQLTCLNSNANHTYLKHVCIQGKIKDKKKSSLNVHDVTFPSNFNHMFYMWLIWCMKLIRVKILLIMIRQCRTIFSDFDLHGRRRWWIYSNGLKESVSVNFNANLVEEIVEWNGIEYNYLMCREIKIFFRNTFHQNIILSPSWFQTSKMAFFRICIILEIHNWRWSEHQPLLDFISISLGDINHWTMKA